MYREKNISVEMLKVLPIIISKWVLGVFLEGEGWLHHSKYNVGIDIFILLLGLVYTLMNPITCLSSQIDIILDNYERTKMLLP